MILVTKYIIHRKYELNKLYHPLFHIIYPHDSRNGKAYYIYVPLILRVHPEEQYPIQSRIKYFHRWITLYRY